MKSKLLVSLVVGTALLVFGCVQGSTPEESETHFLSECSRSCDDGLECLCGVCTRACEPGGDECATLASGATCVPRDAECNGGPKNVCGLASGEGGAGGSGSSAGASGGGGANEGGGGSAGASGGGGANEGGGGSAGASGEGGANEGGGGSGEPLARELYTDPIDPEPVEIEIVNRRSGPIVVGSAYGCQPEYVGITSENEQTPGAWLGSACVQSCANVRAGNIGCDGSCPYATPVVLRPDESLTTSWVGIVGEPVTFETACCENAVSGCAPECSLLRVAAAGAYSATVGYLDLTEEQATACENDMFTCPLAPLGGTEPTRVDIPFTLASGPIVLELEGEDPVVSCEALVDEDPVPVELTITNGFDAPIVLTNPTGCEPEYTAITRITEDVVGSWTGSRCLQSCDRVREGSGGCPADCPFAEPLALLPGESTTVQWSGLLATSASFPEECCESTVDMCADTCAQVFVAPSGAYQATLAYAEATPSQAESCAEDSSTCAVVPPYSTTPPLLVDVAFTHGDGPVELMLGP